MIGDNVGTLKIFGIKCSKNRRYDTLSDVGSGMGAYRFEY